MGEGGTLGVERVCCLLHNLLPGGSARQWVSLLERHVQAGGEATVLAPPGPLSKQASAAGIDLVDVAWSDLPRRLDQGPWPLVARHDAAIVHWDHEVMEAFAPALAACGTAALAVHQAPLALSRWLGDGAIDPARAILEEALTEKQAILVRGEWHRRRFVEAFDLPARDLRILPASIAMPPIAIAATEPPREVLALMRLSPDKAAIAQLAVELVRARLEEGERCRLTVAGDGHWRAGVVDICRRGLPTGAWRFEPGPGDPIDRLAAADLVVAQGLTTLEAAALERPTVVARSLGAERAAGVVLTPARYDVAARDPFGQPETSEDTALLWREILALGRQDLNDLRGLVQRHNNLEATSRALGEALRATAPSGRA